MAHPSPLDVLLAPLPGLPEAELRAASEEEVFDKASFELAKELGMRLAILSATQPADEAGRPIPWPRDQAIVCGLLVRTAKLMTALLGHLASHEAEAAYHLSRPIAETTINLRYLIRCGSPELFDRFVAHSFVNDRRRIQLIERNVAERGGNQEPIETRMLSSIERRLEQAGITLDQVPTKPSPDWAGNVRSRLAELGMEDAYIGIFGGLSAYTHGSWHELVIYHLNEIAGGFEPDTAWSDTRPQMATSVAMLICWAAEDYVGHMVDDEDMARAMGGPFHEGEEQARLLTDLHEDYLARTGGPDLRF